MYDKGAVLISLCSKDEMVGISKELSICLA